MKVLAFMSAHLHRRLATYLSRPMKRYTLSRATDLDRLRETMRAGDVILTEGTTRFAALVRRLTGSPWTHDLKNAVDLARLLFPAPAFAARWRRMMGPLGPLGSADPNKVICSTLLAQAFAAVGLSIAPMTVLGLQRGPIAQQSLDHNYLTPRDFAASPHFQLLESTDAAVEGSSKLSTNA